jgi:uncharacterized membrane protein
MKSTALPTLAALGALSGVRSGIAPALVAESLARKRGRRRSFGARLLGARAAAKVTRAFAATEFVMDQLPDVPNRTSPPALVPRVLAGALVGATLGKDRLVGALIGSSAAFVATFASLRLRLALARKIPGFLAGILEDAAAIGAARLLLPRL